MEYQITLKASTKTQLNALIDKKILEGYLLDGGIFLSESNEFTQSMVQPSNIDGEVSFRSMIFIILYFISLVFLLSYFDIF